MGEVGAGGNRERRGTRPVRVKGVEDEVLRLTRRIMQLEARCAWWRKLARRLAVIATDFRNERDLDRLDAEAERHKREDVATE